MPARITVQWTALKDADWDAALRPRGTRTVLAAVGAELPHRLAEALARRAAVDPSRALAQLGRAERRATDRHARARTAAVDRRRRLTRKPKSRAAASISRRSIRQTMESRRHKGLFLCGEMLDAFGPIGGYNFLWAWATGRAAGIGAADGLR